jgi:hypothetical protein
MRPWLYSDIMMQVHYFCYKKQRKYLGNIICHDEPVEPFAGRTGLRQAQADSL